MLFVVVGLSSNSYWRLKKDITTKNQFDESVALAYKQENSSLSFSDFKSQNRERLLQDFNTKNGLPDFDPRFDVAAEIITLLLMLFIAVITIRIVFGSLMLVHSTNEKLLAQQKELEQLKKKMGIYEEV